MGTNFDYIGSLIVAGLIALIVLSLNVNITRTAFSRNIDLIGQQNATTMLEIFENDLLKAGFRITTGSHVLVADSLHFTFAADIDNNGATDWLAYAVGDSLTTSTSNPNDRPFFRKENNQPAVNIILGLTELRFKYYEETGNLMSYTSLGSQSARDSIRFIGINLTVEPSDPVDTTFIPVTMQRLIRPKNLGGW